MSNLSPSNQNPKLLTSLITIISNMRYYLLKQKLKETLSKVVSCYSLFAPFSPKPTDKVELSVYNDPYSIRKSRLIPVSFCPVRKSFVFDIPKNKFRFNKLYYFSFVINDSYVVDPSFDIKKIDGREINYVNFRDIDDKVQYLQQHVYNIRTYTPRKNYKKSKSEHNINNEEIDECNEDEYEQIRSNNVGKGDNGRKRVYTEDLTVKSILKLRRRSDMRLHAMVNAPLRKVSFGTVEFMSKEKNGEMKRKISHG